MPSDYNKGVVLDKVPTGFGIYTGVVLKNNSTDPVTYTISSNKTTLYKGLNETQQMPVTDGLLDEIANNTIQVSSDLENIKDECYLDLGSSESGIFYITHKPFSTFNEDADGNSFASTGYEISSINISSTSHEGIDDNLITIDVTGQRILDPPNPDKLLKFYCKQGYNETNGFYLDANWAIPEGQNFLTGFVLDICSDNSFSNHIGESPYYIKIEKNTDSSLPDYLGYYNENVENYSHRVEGLSLGDSSIFARIKGLNGLNEESPAAFAKKVEFQENIVFNDETYYSNKVTPGDDLKAVARSLLIETVIDESQNLDLTNLIRGYNNNSYDLSIYDSVYIKIKPKSSDGKLAVINSYIKDSAAILFKKLDKNFKFVKSSAGSKFIVYLDLLDAEVIGYDGKGSYFENGEAVPAESGGALFDLDYIENNGIEIDYYILKNKNSRLLAGLGGASSYTKDTTSDNEVTKSFYAGGVTDRQNTNFLQDDAIVENPIEGNVKNISSRGSDGLLLRKGNKLPDVYLSISGNPSYSSNKLFFRFSSKSLTSTNVGTLSHEWVKYSGIKNVSFKSSSVEGSFYADTNKPLRVCEAYGKKFYELYHSTGINSVYNSLITMHDSDSGHSPKFPVFFGNQQGSVDLRPNYTILVFALGRKDFASSSNTNISASRETSSILLNEMSFIQRFIDSTDWPAEVVFSGNTNLERNSNNNFSASGFSANFKSTLNTNRNNFQTRKNRASFVGSALNSIDYVQPGYLYKKEGNELKDKHFARKDYFYSNKRSSTYNVIGSLDNFEKLWSDLIVYDQTGFNGGGHNSFTPQNSSNTPLFNESDGIFKINNGSEEDLKVFNLYFVLMKSSLGSKNGVNYVNGVEKPLDEILTNETFINGKKVFENNLIMQNTKNPKHMLISLINSSGNTYDGDISNGDRPRLYLMDYMYGVEDTIAQRDITSNNMMDSLICDYRPLILKSSNLQVVKQGQGSSQGEQLSFGLPVSHNYLQIYTG